MADITKRILLITHAFPPYPGVASRRWAKFAKYLAKNNYEIHVVCSTNPFKEEDKNYLEEVIHDNIIIHRINSGYPKYVETPPENMFEKTISKFQYLFLKLFVKGNYYDRSIYYKRKFESFIPSLIDKLNIEKVIVSGAPYRYFYYALFLKKKKNIKLIVDYRDPWSDFNFGYNDESMTRGKRYHFELEQEITVLKNADKVLCVSEFQKKLLQAKVPNHNINIDVIRNGYDDDDFLEVNYGFKNNNDKLKIVHFGSLVEDKSKYYFPLISAIEKIVYSGTNKIALEFYGYVPNELIEEVNRKKLNHIIIFNGKINHKKALSKIVEADIVLWFKYDQGSGDFATKFYEYLKLKKFIWVFTQKGEAAEFVEQNRIGKAFTDTIQLKNEIVEEAISYLKNGKPVFNSTFEIGKFSLKNITDELIKSIES